MKQLSCLLVAVALLLSFTACGDGKTTEATAGDEMTLVIATMPSIDKVPILVAEEKGYFSNRGLTVEIQNYQSPTDRNAVLEAGGLDGLMSDMVAFALYLDNGTALKMTSSIQTEFAILASEQSGITRLGAVPANSTCGIALNCLMEYIADDIGALDKQLLPDVAARVEQVIGGGVDLTIVPEPYGALATARGAVYLGSADDLGLDTAVMLFTEETLTEKANAIDAFYAAYAEAVNDLAKGIDEQCWAAVIEKGQFSPDTKDALVTTTYRLPTAPQESQFTAVQNWMSGKEDFNGSYTYDFNAVSDFTHLPQ